MTGGLRQGKATLCEPVHNRRGFLSGRERAVGSKVGVVRFGSSLRQRAAMPRQVQTWQSKRAALNGDRQWLLRLIATMEQIARPEVRKLPCDQLVLAAVRAQLARPPRAHPPGASTFSLRN